MGAANFAFSAPGRKWQGFETLPFPYTSTVQVCLDHSSISSVKPGHILTYNVVHVLDILDISGRGMVLRSSNIFLTNTKAYMGKNQSRISEPLYFFFVCIIITPILICGCSHFNKGFRPSQPSKKRMIFSARETTRPL